MSVAAIDPGSSKCGFAILGEDGTVCLHRVIETAKLEQETAPEIEKHAAGVLVLGNGTTSRSAQARLQKVMPALKIEVVDEYRTTDEARKLYWKLNPPRGLWRLIPTTMRVPPVPVDDLVAVILARRYLGNC